MGRARFVRSDGIALPVAAAIVLVAGAATSVVLLASTVAPAAALTQVPMGLPWLPNKPATLIAGPHQNNFHACNSSAPCNSLDLAPADGFAQAAAAGTAYRPCANLVIVDHHNGWYTGYYHLTDIAAFIPNSGVDVAAGAALGHIGQGIGCGGGADVDHVHFSLKHTGGSGGLTATQWFSTSGDVDLQNVVIAGWQVTKSPGPHGCMTYIGPGPHNGQRVCDGGTVVNYGAAAPSRPTYLSNGSFEVGTTASWGATSGVNLVAYSSTASRPAHDGRWVGETNTPTAGGFVYEDVSAASEPSLDLTSGHSYWASVWLRSTTNTPFRVCFHLQALGGTVEDGNTCASIGKSWTPLTAPLDLTGSGHNALRVAVTELTTGVNLDLDGMTLASTHLSNASFEAGTTAGWGATSGVNVVAYSSTASRPAHDGQWVAETNTPAAGGFVYHDVGAASDPALDLTAGHSYTATVWLRSTTNTPFRVCFHLQALGGTVEDGNTCASIGKSWTPLTAPLSIQQAGHTALRVAVTELTTGQNLDLDGMTLSPSPAVAPK
jgi:hypothetical protein